MASTSLSLAGPTSTGSRCTSSVRSAESTTPSTPGWRPWPRIWPTYSPRSSPSKAKSNQACEFKSSWQFSVSCLPSLFGRSSSPCHESISAIISLFPGSSTPVTPIRSSGRTPTSGAASRPRSLPISTRSIESTLSCLVTAWRSTLGRLGWKQKRLRWRGYYPREGGGGKSYDQKTVKKCCQKSQLTLCTTPTDFPRPFFVFFLALLSCLFYFVLQMMTVKLHTWTDISVFEIYNNINILDM